jgi:hypothetical protein
MEHTKFKQVIEDIKKQLDSIKYDGDLSDIGNEIGIAIGPHIEKDGYEETDFVHGVRHGISLIDGTHD